MNSKCILSAFVVLLMTNTLFAGENYFTTSSSDGQEKPNIIMLMADDLGWGDVGFNGNDVVMTPYLDAMSEAGVKFTQFYAAAPLCSPSRAACLTGRAPFRQGIYAAHTGAMRHAEKTIPELLKSAGYQTGFFGKWHLGWIEPDVIETRGHYSPPRHHGFDETFATKSAVPTWNPTKVPAGWKAWGTVKDKEGNVIDENWAGSRYMHNGEVVTKNLDGDDSRVIMDRAIPFMEKAIKKDEPFLATIWFHTPHEPVVAGPEYLAMYPGLREEQKHLYGCITAMDEQVGRLMQFLKDNNIEENTLILFTSDNGPSGPITRKGIASAGPFKGNKHEIWEGGIRVPSLMYWKGHISSGVCDATTGAVDYLPTILDIVGEPQVKKRPIDGESLLPILTGIAEDRESTMAFGFKRLHSNTEMYAFIDGEYKLAIPKMGKGMYLFNIEVDSTEQNNLADSDPELTDAMFKKLSKTIDSWQASDDGKDYTW